MRAKGATFQQVLLGTALLAAVAWNLAHAGEVRSLQLSSGPTGTRAELRLDHEAGYQLISLANPDRLVVDLPGSSLRRGMQLPAAVGVVSAVRSGQPQPGTTRIVFDLTVPVTALKPHYEPGADGPRLVLEWPDDGVQPVATNAAPSTKPSGAAADPEAIINGAVPSIAASAAATSRLIASLSKPQVAPVPASAAAISGQAIQGAQAGTQQPA